MPAPWWPPLGSPRRPPPRTRKSNGPRKGPSPARARKRVHPVGGPAAKVAALTKPAEKETLQASGKAKAAVRGFGEPPFHSIKNNCHHRKGRALGLANNGPPRHALGGRANALSPRALNRPTSHDEREILKRFLSSECEPPRPPLTLFCFQISCGMGVQINHSTLVTRYGSRTPPKSSCKRSPDFLPRNCSPNGDCGVMTRISRPSCFTSVPPAFGPMK